jgi:hypothetical protein
MPAQALAAIPLLVKFAEVAGIVVSGIATAAGIEKLSDKVETYIEENPENAEKIFAMIMPAQGLANFLKNESSEGNEEVSETEEVTESESGSTKDMVLEELNKEKGNYSSPDATGNYASERGRIIGRLRKEGKIRQDNDPNYDPDKKYKDYTKFYKNKKADGGMAGTKTYHQYHDQYVPMDSEGMGYANGGGVGSMLKRKSFRGGGMDMGNASNQAQSASMGGSGRGGDLSNATQNRNHQAAMRNAQNSKKNFITKFNDHDKFTDALKLTTGIPNYHQLGGLDFMSRFPGINPSVAKALAKGYQYTTEGARALTNPDIDFADAMNKAKEETRLNSIGIDDFANPESVTYTQYQDLVPETGKVLFANGGGVGSMMQPKKKRVSFRGGGMDMGNQSNQDQSAAMGGGNTNNNTGGGGETNRPNPHTDSGYSKTSTVSGDRMRSSAREFVQQLNNDRAIAAGQGGPKFESYGGGSRPQNTGIFGGGFNPLAMIAGLFGGPLAGLLTRGLMMGKDKLIGLNDSIQNSDFGRSKTLADYFDARKYGGIDARDAAAKANMADAKNITNRISTDFNPRGPNEMPAVNITGLNNNDYEGEIGAMNNNDFSGVQNVDRSLTSNQINEFEQSPEFKTSLINEFGQSPEFNTSLINEFGDNRNKVNEFGQSPEFNTSLINEFGQSPEFKTSLINEFGIKDKGILDANAGFQGIPGTSDQGFGIMNSDAAKKAAMSVIANAFKENTMPGTSDMGYPDRNMNFPVDLGETTAYNDADFVNKYGYPLTASLVNNIKPVITQENTAVGAVPKGAGFIMDGDLGSLRSTVDFSDMINKDINPELNYTGNFLDGKTNLFGNYKDGSGNITGTYGDGNINSFINYDGDSPSAGIQFNKQYEGGNPLKAILESLGIRN